MYFGELVFYNTHVYVFNNNEHILRLWWHLLNIFIIQKYVLMTSYGKSEDTSSVNIRR